MSEFRTINELSSDVHDKALTILNEHNNKVNPEGKDIYSGDNFKSYYVISLTGNRRSYYTLYMCYNITLDTKFTRKDYYICNLSTDLIEAVSKICTGHGTPVVLYAQDNFNPERIPSTYFPIGKYKGQSLADVYEKDPNYIIWAASNLSVKKGTKVMEMMIQGLQHLKDVHFQMLTEKNRETSASEYVGDINSRIDITITIIKKFTPSPSNLVPSPNTKYTARDRGGNQIQFYYKGSNLEVNSTHSIRGTIKKHFESLGIKSTSVNRVVIS